MPNADDKFVLKPRTYLVCKRGHVRFAPAHPLVTLMDDDENPVESIYLCPSCQYEFFALMFGAVLMPPMTTREDAEAKAADLKAQHEALNATNSLLGQGGPQ